MPQVLAPHPPFVVMRERSVNANTHHKCPHQSKRQIRNNEDNIIQQDTMNLISQHAIRPARINYIHTHKKGQHASPRPTCNSKANTHQQNQHTSTRTTHINKVSKHHHVQNTSIRPTHIHKANTHQLGQR